MSGQPTTSSTPARPPCKTGSNWTRLNTSNWPPGAVRILIQFPVPPQPDFVVERYGELGETLSGDNVTTPGGMRMIEIEETFQFTP